MFDSLFGSDKKAPEATPPTVAEQLHQAVYDRDLKTAARLLEAANGPCEARKLMEDAQKVGEQKHDGWISISAQIHGSELETLQINKYSGNASIPFISIDQPRCKE